MASSTENVRLPVFKKKTGNAYISALLDGLKVFTAVTEMKKFLQEDHGARNILVRIRKSFLSKMHIAAIVSGQTWLPNMVKDFMTVSFFSKRGALPKQPPQHHQYRILLANDKTLDLVGSFVDLENLGITHLLSIG